MSDFDRSCRSENRQQQKHFTVRVLKGVLPVKSLRNYTILLLVFLLTAGFIAGCGSNGDNNGGGDDTGTVAGKITDISGNPVSGAVCSINTGETSSKETYSDTTGNDGIFNIPGVPPGTWNLLITASGYQTLTLSITVTSGGTTSVPESETQVSPSGKGTVTGTATDAANSLPLQGVSITVTGASAPAVSASDGTYTVTDITSGSQTVAAVKTGYVNYSSSVNVVADSTVTHNISMTPEQIPEPDPGKGHVKGKVIDDNENGIPGVTCTIVEKGKATITAQTDSTGNYILLNVNAGSQAVNMTKTGYNNALVGITVVEGQTVTADTVTMGTEVSTGSTLLCSIPRTGEIAARDSEDPAVSDDGGMVVFYSDQPLVATHISNDEHVYLFRSSSGVVTMVDKNYQGLESNDEGFFATISGDGSRIAFASDASDLLGQGADGNDARDIFIYDVSTGVITRVSTDFSNKAIGGNFDSDLPCISGDGNYVAFSSVADNLCNPGLYTDPGQADTVNIYRATIGSDGKTASMMMISQRQRGGECDPNDWLDGFAQPVSRNSAQPYISFDGRFVIYVSDAQKGVFWDNVGHGAADADKTLVQTPDKGRDIPGVDYDVFLCDTSKTVSTMTTFVSINEKQQTQPSFFAGGFWCSNPSVSDDGKYAAFECMDGSDTWTAASDNITDVWIKNLSTGELRRITDAGGGSRGDSTNPRISRDGTLCVFDSAADGFVQNDTNKSNDIFVYSLVNGTYTRVNLTSNNQQAEDTVTGGGNGSLEPCLSGNNNYVVFESDAKNLVQNQYFTPGSTDIYLRKWK